MQNDSTKIVDQCGLASTVEPHQYYRPQMGDKNIAMNEVAGGTGSSDMEMTLA